MRISTPQRRFQNVRVRLLEVEVDVCPFLYEDLDNGSKSNAGTLMQTFIVVLPYPKSVDPMNKLHFDDGLESLNDILFRVLSVFVTYLKTVHIMADNDGPG